MNEPMPEPVRIRKRKTTTKSVIRSIRIPVELDERINILARKGLMSKNKWIVKTLKREAAPKPTIYNEKNSENDKNE